MAALVLAAVIWWNPVQRCGSVPSGRGGAVAIDGPPPRDATADVALAVEAGSPPDAHESVDVLGRTDAAAPIDAPPPTDAPPLPPLYTVTEALADIQSGPLTFIGTGPWPGLFGMSSCAYRNERVLVRYEYCTHTEQDATNILVVSPTRGSFEFYAESETGPSTTPRADYVTFRITVQIPPANDPPDLSFTYDELAAWYERTGRHFTLACFYGTSTPDGDCVGDDGGRLAAWLESAQPFIEAPPTTWYSVVKSLVTNAKRDRKRTRPSDKATR